MPNDQILTMPSQKSQNGFNAPTAPKATPKPAPSQFEESNIKPPKKGVGGIALIVIILLTLLIGASGAGAAVYFWLNSQHQTELEEITAQLNTEITQKQVKIVELQDQVNKLEQEATDTQNQLSDLGLPKIELTINDNSLKGELWIDDELTYTTEEAGEYLQLFKQTANNIYLTSHPDGVGGYVNYQFWPTALYQYSLLDKTVKKLVDIDELGSIQDMSANEKLITYFKDHKIYLYDLENKEVLGSFDVNEKYEQYGDLLLSPDGTKIAYAAAIGDMDNEESAIFIIDTENNITNKIIEKQGAVYHTDKWGGNNDEDLSYYYFKF